MTVFTFKGGTVVVKADNSVPLEVGWDYNITPGCASSQWVTITDIHRGYVYTEGVDSTTADWTVPVWKFDDLVKGWVERGFYLLTEDGQFYLATENDDLLVGE